MKKRDGEGETERQADRLTDRQTDGKRKELALCSLVYSQLIFNNNKKKAEVWYHQTQDLPRIVSREQTALKIPKIHINGTMVVRREI